MGKRRRARELVLQFLYQVDMNPPNGFDAGKRDVGDGNDAPNSGTGQDPDSIIEKAIVSFWENFKTQEELKPFFRELTRGVLAHHNEIDGIINASSENWRLSRMSVVDRNILRFSVYELLFIDDIPPNVTINEAIEIAKRFGTADSPSFINGILDNISNTHIKRKEIES